MERLFPFVLRSRNLLVGRETLGRNKSRLHFVLITLDISEQSRAEVLSDFSHYPVVQLYTSAELEQYFGVKGAKVIGFAEVGTGAIRLRRAEAAPAQQTGKAVSGLVAEAFRLQFSYRRSARVNGRLWERKLISIREMAVVTSGVAWPERTERQTGWAETQRWQPAQN